MVDWYVWDLCDGHIVLAAAGVVVMVTALAYGLLWALEALFRA